MCFGRCLSAWSFCRVCCLYIVHMGQRELSEVGQGEVAGFGGLLSAVSGWFIVARPLKCDVNGRRQVLAIAQLLSRGRKGAALLIQLYLDPRLS